MAIALWKSLKPSLLMRSLWQLSYNGQLIRALAKYWLGPECFCELEDGVIAWAMNAFEWAIAPFLIEDRRSLFG
ncbi:MAG: hypothetical protein QNJ46_32205 [Leptolyngbyaceae cyanobacterium MO_188.B28]|nr:hypothetical protein [Leptolyngbyaceae cyanobacterium MO_188.B28]